MGFADVDLCVTSIQLNMRHPQAQAEMRDLCRMHTRIVDATVGMPTDGPRILHAQPRLDMLVIRAAEPITAARLPNNWATRTHHRLWQPPERPGRYRMVAVLNPGRHATTAGPTANQPDRQREQVQPRLYTTPGEQAEWLGRRLTPGATIDRYQATRAWVGRGRHRTGRTVTCRQVAVACEVTVHDPDAIRDRLLAGIGIDKTWGCGLTLWEPM